MPVFRFFLAMLMLAAPARGEIPVVVADIAPVQSLVATVMGGLGVPDLLMRANAPPHGDALRPSQARALRRADLVVWVGPALTPWLGKPIETLAGDAERLELLGTPGTRVLAYRGGNGRGFGRDGDTGIDPHAWLDPRNGRVWLGLIADRLAGLDPANGARYRANALAGQLRLDALQGEIGERLKPMRGRAYVTYHDAYQYFETRFGLTPTGAVRPGDATGPGPAALARLRRAVAAAGAVCAFGEARSDPALLYTVFGRDDLKVTMLDPLGGAQPAGPGLYPGLLREMARAFAGCAGAG